MDADRHRHFVLPIGQLLVCVSLRLIIIQAHASPWDSAMPSWKDDLTDEEIWKIILAKYDTAGVEPRKPETLQ